jgi:uncharacterized protein YecT (DUF1311 family)
MILLSGFIIPFFSLSAYADDCSMDGSQSEMNDCSRRQLTKSDTELNQEYKQIINCMKPSSKDAKPLIEAQRAWLKYRDAECAFQGSASKGGSIQPMIITGCLKNITDQRAKDLKYYLTCEEGDLSCPTFNCGFNKRH